MRKFLIIVPLFVLLGGCWLSQNLSPEMQSKWQGRPVSDLQAKMGQGHLVSDTNGQKYYYWRQAMQRTSTGITSPMGWSEVVSCEFRVYVDSQNKITNFTTHNKGLNCADYKYILEK